ncbi:transposase [Pelagibacterium lentulum]|uniref:Transposase n=1 Tax=Pelagibacterium lentulum TaxID=2029865 RepID=A0A916RBP1_9HYPH|nr:transposase [Pelagibacterium lentulum]
MGNKDRQLFTPEFKKEAGRLTQTSDRTIGQLAADLGIGLSTLTRWNRQYRYAEILAGPDDDSAKELARLRKENELLRQEREILKRAAAFFAKEGARPGAPLGRATRPNDEIQAYR